MEGSRSKATKTRGKKVGNFLEACRKLLELAPLWEHTPTMETLPDSVAGPSLSGFAYTLSERLRVHLKNTPFERMSASHFRLKLIKVGTVIIRNTRRIQVPMSDGYPDKDELTVMVRCLVFG